VYAKMAAKKIVIRDLVDLCPRRYIVDCVKEVT